MKPYRLIPLITAAVIILSCDSYDSITGSFEETMESGRINTDVSPKRFFRFHFRQFEDSIGGTFETFDMTSYTPFSQVPLIMNTPLNLYYCSRIDYGYIRNGKGYVFFTDKEQRQWIFITELGNNSLSGSLIRSDRLNTLNYSLDPEYLLPEDAEYYQKKNNNNNNNDDDDETPQPQIDLKHMSKSSDNAFNCIYYYKTLPLNFIISDLSFLDTCTPSKKKCNNYKLAIIGTKPHRRLEETSTSSLIQIQSAHLDDRDIIPNNVRPISLRENPQTISGYQSNFFLTTAVIYKDENENENWDISEPILASLNSQTLMFYSSPPDAIYGESPNDDIYEPPILTKDNIDQFTGWHIYNDKAETSEQYPLWRVLKNLSPISDTSLTLSPIPSGPCFVVPTDNNQKQCPPLFPIIIQ